MIKLFDLKDKKAKEAAVDGKKRVAPGTIRMQKGAPCAASVA